VAETIQCPDCNGIGTIRVRHFIHRRPERASDFYYTSKKCVRCKGIGYIKEVKIPKKKLLTII